MRQAGWRLSVKKATDRCAAAAGLFVLGPLLAVTALAVRRSMGTPVLFRQTRPGLNGAPFTVVKFRTMRHAHDVHGNPLPDADRLTPLGRFLRSTSLDEFPQLWNVLRGDLSLVGPRPLLTQYLERYTPEQARRHDVLPGITGWAQIHGRNATRWSDRLSHDVWYADHWSLWLDARILMATASRVIRREGVSREGHATMPEFMGVGDE